MKIKVKNAFKSIDTSIKLELFSSCQGVLYSTENAYNKENLFLLVTN